MKLLYQLFLRDHLEKYQPIMGKVVEQWNQHPDLISFYQLLIGSDCSNTGR